MELGFWEDYVPNIFNLIYPDLSWAMIEIKKKVRRFKEIKSGLRCFYLMTLMT